MIDLDTVIAMAKQAGALRFSHPYRDEESDSWAASTDNIERFAKLVEQRAAEAEREACARINAEKSERLGQEAEHALEEGDRDTCTSNRAAAHLLSVCAARIRARGTGGEG